MPTKSARKPASSGPGKKRRARRPPAPPANVCTVPKCGRAAYARGLCQTHHRQLLTTGKLKSIRPYRKRSPSTVKFSGLRLSPDTAEQVEQYALDNHVSLGAAIAFILERWLVKRR